MPTAPVGAASLALLSTASLDVYMLGQPCAHGSCDTIKGRLQPSCYTCVAAACDRTAGWLSRPPHACHPARPAANATQLAAVVPALPLARWAGGMRPLPAPQRVGLHLSGLACRFPAHVRMRGRARCCACNVVVRIIPQAKPCPVLHAHMPAFDNAAHRHHGQPCAAAAMHVPPAANNPRTHAKRQQYAKQAGSRCTLLRAAACCQRPDGGSSLQVHGLKQLHMIMRKTTSTGGTTTSATRTHAARCKPCAASHLANHRSRTSTAHTAAPARTRHTCGRAYRCRAARGRARGPSLRAPRRGSAHKPLLDYPAPPPTSTETARPEHPPLPCTSRQAGSGVCCLCSSSSRSNGAARPSSSHGHSAPHPIPAPHLAAGCSACLAGLARQAIRPGMRPQTQPRAEPRMPAGTLPA